MNKKQTKCYYTTVGISVIILIMLLLFASCSFKDSEKDAVAEKESVARNELLKRERVALEENINSLKGLLSVMVSQYNSLRDEVRTMEIEKDNPNPKYTLTINVKHIRKYRRDCMVNIEVSKDMYYSVQKGNSLPLYGNRVECFDLVIVNKTIN